MGRNYLKYSHLSEKKGKLVCLTICVKHQLVMKMEHVQLLLLIRTKFNHISIWNKRLRRLKGLNRELKREISRRTSSQEIFKMVLQLHIQSLNYALQHLPITLHEHITAHPQQSLQQNQDSIRSNSIALQLSNIIIQLPILVLWSLPTQKSSIALH